MKTERPRRASRRKGQSIVELALTIFLLMAFLAAAVDLGRVFYTYIAVENMVGEAATYLANNPNNDYVITGVDNNDTFQRRAANVALSDGRIIDRDKLGTTGPTLSAHVRLLPNIAQSARCVRTPFTVSVSYPMDDLFFPAFLGFNSIDIGVENTSQFLVGNC